MTAASKVRSAEGLMAAENNGVTFVKLIWPSRGVTEAINNDKYSGNICSSHSTHSTQAVGKSLKFKREMVHCANCGSCFQFLSLWLLETESRYCTLVTGRYPQHIGLMVKLTLKFNKCLQTPIPQFQEHTFKSSGWIVQSSKANITSSLFQWSFQEWYLFAGDSFEKQSSQNWHKLENGNSLQENATRQAVARHGGGH